MLASDERRALNKEKAAAEMKARHGSGRRPLVLGMRKLGREGAKVTGQCWKFCGQPSRGLDVLVCAQRTDLGIVSLWKVPEAT